MNAIQLDFFRTSEESEIISLRQEVKELEASLGRVRRALFARHGALALKQNEFENRLDILERNICRG